MTSRRRHHQAEPSPSPSLLAIDAGLTPGWSALRPPAGSSSCSSCRSSSSSSSTRTPTTTTTTYRPVTLRPTDPSIPRRRLSSPSSLTQTPSCPTTDRRQDEEEGRLDTRLAETEPRLRSGSRNEESPATSAAAAGVRITSRTVHHHPVLHRQQIIHRHHRQLQHQQLITLITIIGDGGSITVTITVVLIIPIIIIIIIILVVQPLISLSHRLMIPFLVPVPSSSVSWEGQVFPGRRRPALGKGSPVVAAKGAASPFTCTTDAAAVRCGSSPRSTPAATVTDSITESALSTQQSLVRRIVTLMKAGTRVSRTMLRGTRASS